MFTPNYPNVELLAYKAKQLLSETDHFKKKLEAARAKNRFTNVYLDAQVFPQTWGSTCLGFDVTPSGEPTIGGCAMTKAYTSVFHEASISDSYVVFFGDQAAYLVTEPTEKFLEDLRNHDLGRISFAKNNY